jgi:hypothetical protein
MVVADSLLTKVNLAVGVVVAVTVIGMGPPPSVGVVEGYMVAVKVTGMVAVTLGAKVTGTVGLRLGVVVKVTGIAEVGVVIRGMGLPLGPMGVIARSQAPKLAKSTVKTAQMAFRFMVLSP